MIPTGADRLLDQFDGILRQSCGFGSDIEIIPALIGIDDQARARRTAVDGGNPVMVMVAGQFELEQYMTIRRRLARLAFHHIRGT